MTRRRFIADELTGDRATLTGLHAAHLARVLRAKVGQEYEVAAGGEVHTARILAVSEERIDLQLLEKIEAEIFRPITLAMAVFKFDRFEWAIEKCTELGVLRIVPLIVRRTDAHLASAAQKRVERWRRIAREASQQSRRPNEPDITDPMKLSAYLPNERTALRVLLSENEVEVQLRDYSSGMEDIVLAVGPEGGWAENEFEMFQSAGWKSASLGGSILRAETAAIAALAIVRALSE